MHDPGEILRKAESYRTDMLQFLRDLCAIPSESGMEREAARRVQGEMEKLEFDEVRIDGMGNVLGRVGRAARSLAMDGHLDTVGIGDRSAWQWDPYKGKLENGIFFARGASDQKGGLAGMVYGARIIKDLALAGDYSLWIAGTVQEEDCEGICWQHILKEGHIHPEIVILTEPTNLTICRGHRGRVEIGVTAHGVSCHGSAPERGKNAIYMMTGIIQQIEKLNERLPADDFLGKGTVAVTFIECATPSVCAVPDRAYIHVDRRLTRGETSDGAVAEVRDAVRRAGVEAEVEILRYAVPSYTNLVYETEKSYPAWMLDPGNRACRAAVENYQALFGQEPQLGKWAFSTNGIATMGLNRIPTIGFGPGNELHAHTVADQVHIDDLVRAAAFYAGFPSTYCAL